MNVKPVPKVPAPLYCSFCGKAEYQVRQMIASPGFVFICDECVALCSFIVAEARGCREMTAADLGLPA